MRVKSVDRKYECMASQGIVDIGVPLRTPLGACRTATAAAMTAREANPDAMLEPVAVGIVAPPCLRIS